MLVQLLVTLLVGATDGFKFGKHKEDEAKAAKEAAEAAMKNKKNPLAEFLTNLDDNSKIAIAGGITLLFLIIGAYMLFGKSKRKKYDSEKAFKFVKPRTKSAVPEKSAPKSSAAKPATAPALAPSSAESDMRGYKKTADGKTTTYFHRELSEEDKKLLGDSTPKPISTTGGASEGAAGVGSAWNGAGTWEEKSYTSWANNHLKELLTGASMGVPAAASSSKDLIKVLRVNTVEGDAVVASSRGQRKYIYDLAMTIDWKLQLGSVLSVSGAARVTDITADGDFEVEVTQVNAMQSVSSVAKNGIEKYVRSQSDGLQFLLKKKLGEFLDDLKKQDQQQ